MGLGLGIIKTLLKITKEQLPWNRIWKGTLSFRFQ
jgi:hypothetical protein